MLLMLIRRLLLGLVTVCLVSLIIFAGVEILPGDACTQFLGEYQADDELLEQCRKDLDLNRPAYDRFSEWAGGAVTGDLGLAVDGKTKISTIVGDRLQNSLLLALCAMSIG
ncbi:MAG: ABC transporter permease, partial [Alphaproteobacteria bacterium]